MSRPSIENLMDNMGVALRKNREQTAKTLLQHTELFSELIKFVFKTDYKLHYKAAWTLEIVLEKDLKRILLYINYFTKNLHQLQHESAIRPIAKIGKWIAFATVKKQDKNFVEGLSMKNIEQLVETNFDWLIGDFKVAPQVYAMDTLYYFGLLDTHRYKWIHKELKSVLLQNIQTKSPAYKAHAKMILALLT